MLWRVIGGASDTDHLDPVEVPGSERHQSQEEQFEDRDIDLGQDCEHVPHGVFPS